MAGAANPQGLTNVQGVEPVKFKTRDGITLGGYKLAAEYPKTYLLVAQGNAMLADQLIADLQTFRDERNPGKNDRSTSTYHTLPSEIRPGGSLPFTFTPSPPLAQASRYGSGLRTVGSCARRRGAFQLT
jgi:hypothetical protein